ncbi:hypothetical protein [Caballeronia sp. LZ043]|uniref:hypothetical protein n=1 Tax=Caballeronia sp. LZ043 TaxID=3038569 RepID=UPI0028549AB6|nr:hypothetical protein [Caballeronia sp. LZ043]MDR5822402.1 hypothetical protein [Caballeronia sp. LZ043]
MTNTFDVQGTSAVPAHFSLMSTPPDPSTEGKGDGLDDLLDETGATTHRSTGKVGTDTKAEPDPKPKPSSSAQPEHIEQQPVPGHTENIPANPAEPAPRGPNEDRASDARPDDKPGTPPGTQSGRDRNKSPD